MMAVISVKSACIYVLYVLFILCLFSFGSCVLPGLPDSINQGNNGIGIDAAIVEYFKAGYKYSTIFCLLSLYHGTRMGKCLRFSFMDILQEELDRVVRKWNHHTIRPTRGAECSHGKPNVLYLLPEQNGTHDYKCTISGEEITWALSMCTLVSNKSGDDATDDYFTGILQRDNLRLPTNWDEAVQTYFHLLQSV